MGDNTSIKVLHTSDWHLGINLHGRSFLEDQKHILDQIIEHMEKGVHDALVISGDIYDRSIPPASAVEVLSSFLFRLKAKSDAPVIIIPGNHDSARRLAYGDKLFRQYGIHLVCDVEDAFNPVRIEKGGRTVDIYGLPWISRIRAEAGAGDDTFESTNVHESVQKVISSFGESDWKMLAAHLFVRNCRTSESERQYVGLLEAVESELFSPFDYTALGHLHSYQHAGHGAYYCGAILPYSFSESRENKVCVSVSFSDEGITSEALPLTPLRQMVRIEAPFVDLLNDTAYDGHADHYVEAVLTDPVMVPHPSNLLAKRFPNLLSVRQKPTEAVISESEINFSPREEMADTYAHFHSFLYDEGPSREKLDLFVKLVSGELDKNEA